VLDKDGMALKCLSDAASVAIILKDLIASMQVRCSLIMQDQHIGESDDPGVEARRRKIRSTFGDVYCHFTPLTRVTHMHTLTMPPP